MKVLVTGATGQLGFDVCSALASRGIEYKGVGSRDLDICDRAAVEEYLSAYVPEAVIHCAAYNAVDKAEEDAERCNLVNASGTENVALACRKINAKIMFFSSDYVFSGDKKGEYEVNDEKRPLGVYGESKSLAEEKIKKIADKYFILRISWLFGINGNNFVKKILKLSENANEINVVSDQIGSPTYTKELAKLVCDMIATEKYGIYHATNEGFCSWAEFAKKIFELTGRKTAVNPITSDELFSGARRPLHSRLSKKSLDLAGFSGLTFWENALERYLKEMEQQV